MITIEYYKNPGCQPCVAMYQVMVVVRPLLEILDIDYEMKEILDKVENVPVLHFWANGKKISEINGLPKAENPKAEVLVILRFILQGIYDCTKNEFIEKYARQIDEYYKQILEGKL
jgi:thioredoxin-related protein